MTVPPDSRAALADILGCKWTMDVLRAIETSHLRPSALRRAIPGLSTKVMNERLRKLMRFGVLDRRVLSDRPSRVEYRLHPAAARSGHSSVRSTG